MTRYVLSPDGRTLRPAPTPPSHHPAAVVSPPASPAAPARLTPPAIKFTLAPKAPKKLRR